MISDASVGEATTWEWARVSFPCVPRPDGFIRFDFTYRIRPFATYGLDFAALGTPTLRNWASVIAPPGIDSFISRNTRTYTQDLAPLWFHFQGPVRQPNASNIYFYWGFTRNYTPGGIDSLEFGSTTIAPGAVYIVCGEDEPHTEFGATLIEHEVITEQYLEPTGEDYALIDPPYIWTWLQYVEQQTGPPFTEFGEPSLLNKHEFIRPSGEDWLLMDEDTWASHSPRYPSPSGIAPPKFVTETLIENWTKSSTETTCGNTAEFGETFISNWVRWLPLPSASEPPEIEEPWVQAGRRYIDLTDKGIGSTILLGYNLIENDPRYFAGPDFDSLTFGSILVEFDNNAWVRKGPDTLEFGQHEIRLVDQVITFKPIVPAWAEWSLRFGTATIFNSLQHLVFEDTTDPWNWITVGAHNIRNQFQTLRPDGFRSSVIPLFFDGIYLVARLLEPGGLEATEFGDVDIHHERVTQIIEVFNPDDEHTEWGEPTLLNKAPDIINVVPGIFDPNGGIPLVAWRVRWLDLFGAELSSLRVGSASIFDPVQIIDLENESKLHTQFGNLLTSRDIPVSVRSYTANLEFGEPSLVFGNWAGAEGFDSSKIGALAFVPSRFTRFIRLGPQLVSLSIGRESKIFNSDQYIISNLTYAWIQGPFFGEPHLRNRNRALRPSGWDSRSLSYYFPLLRLGARIVSVPSLGAQSNISFRATATHGIRYIYPPGKAYTLFSPWTMGIYNNAKLISIPGVFTEVIVSKHRLTNTRRWFQHHTPHRGNFIGEHFIAPAIRSLFIGDYRGNQTRVGVHYIGLLQQFIEPSGIQSMSPGFLEARGPFKRGFSPQMPSALVFGTARVVNRNREVFCKYGIPPPRTETATWISHSPRYLAPGGLRSKTVISTATWIRDRTQTISLEQKGPFTWVCTRNHRVRIYPEPVPIFDPVIDLIGQGLERDEQFGYPAIDGSLRQMEGFDSSEFGEPDCRSQNAIVRNYNSSMEFGYARTNSTQIITLPYVPPGEPSLLTTQWSPQRVSPYTVWCTPDTPQQALDNYPQSRLFCLIQAVKIKDLCTEEMFPLFGAAKVTNRHRAIAQYHGNTSNCDPSHRIGFSRIVHGKQVVIVDGIKVWRVAIPYFSPRLLHIRVTNASVSTLFGELIVVGGQEPVSTKTLLASGEDSFSAGDTRVELKNRAVLLSGKEHTTWGNNQPMVHFPRFWDPLGLDATQWGEKTWISYRNRSFLIPGIEPPAMEWELFNDKMSITYISGGYGSGSKACRNVSLQDTSVIPSPSLCGGLSIIYAYMIPPIEVKDRTEIKHA